MTTIAPRFVGSGALATGSPGSLVLAGSKPSAICVLCVSASSSRAPFEGEMLALVPPLLTFTLATSAEGTLTLPFTWPGGVPSGASLRFQVRSPTRLPLRAWR